MTLNLPDLTVIVALIGGWFSLLGLLISKEQKVSEFRQQWIDALRVEVSSLISHANSLHAFWSVTRALDREAFEKSRLDYTGINQAAAQIRMRLNPDEETSKAVLSKIAEIENLLAPGSIPDYRTLNDVEKELVIRTNVVLKSEWKRVKSGEPVFTMIKWISGVIVLAAIATVSLYAVWDFIRNIIQA